MAVLQLVMAPDPIFKQVAAPVGKVTDEIRQLMDDMLETLHAMKGIGMAATMVDVLKRVIVIDWVEEEEQHRLFMADPEIVEKSDTVQTFNEASMCYPGISADITRPDRVKVRYMDYQGEWQELEAGGFLATVIQHEMDYLDGKVYLDYLSRLKRDTLLRKMQKFMKQYASGHVCSSGCAH